MLKVFKNSTIYTGNEVIAGKSVVVREGIVESVIDDSEIPQGAELVDCRGNNLAPGFLDLQIAGGGGFLFSSNPAPEALERIAEAITASGTTAFLIAIPTNSFDVYRKVIRVVKDNPHPAVLGLHIEGPYINPLRRGAHIREYIKLPEVNELKELITLAGGVVKMITLAPEICSREIISMLNDYGIVVAAGHSNATYLQGMEGFRNGIRTTTHLFNAMSQLHHRDPGLPGAVFQSETACASIIADGIHVDYSMVSIAKKLLKERLFLISDAVEENSAESYMHVRKGDRFTLPDGTLSGSALTMMKAVENCVRNISIPVDEALRMASLYPARLMGLGGRGRIETGSRADLVLFDNNFNVEMVCLNGNMV